MGGKPSKRPRPSYERGKLRDPGIEKMQDAGYSKQEFVKLVRKAAKKASK